MVSPERSLASVSGSYIIFRNLLRFDRVRPSPSETNKLLTESPP